jgi:phosphoenolpyruvate---glycerone phosphotransferase subunit DhaL
MKNSVPTHIGKILLINMIKTIQENHEYLSEIDGLIGDGDHGINMNKGFTITEKLIHSREEISCSSALEILGNTLLNEIGGSLGPLYGLFFLALSEKCINTSEINATTLYRMIITGRLAIQEIGLAKLGDKTVLDTLIPAENALLEGLQNGASFNTTISAMVKKAQEGMENTKKLKAKIGRASRLGDRSIGFLDPGAVSMYLILKAFAESFTEELEK